VSARTFANHNIYVLRNTRQISQSVNYAYFVSEYFINENCCKIEGHKKSV
jgi:hypothetical protein